MGYTRSGKIFKLKFADPEFEGLEVRARATSMRGFRAIARLGMGMGDFDPARAMDNPEQTFGILDDVFEVFAAALVSWNLEEDDGTPVPATKEGLESQDPEFCLQVINAWAEAVAGASGPLGQPSNGGSPPPEASIPTETLSPSLAS